MNGQTSGSSRVGSFLFGFVAAFATLFLFAFVYLKYGKPPVATADPAFPFEERIVSVPLNARIDRELTPPPPQPDQAGMEAGAHLYVANCASCHGVPGHNSTYAKYMYPQSPQLWHAHGKGVVGVSDDEVGESYWKIDNGIRLSGMPSFQKTLSKPQMWQIAYLVKNADKPLSPAVTAILQSDPVK